MDHTPDDADRTLPSACPLDCPDRCSLHVRVRNDRVISTEGSRTNRLTGGFICDKVRRFARRVHGPDRLLYPQRRRGPKGKGEFVRTSWDEAITEIARRFQEVRQRFGSEAILPFYYGGSNGLLTQGLVDAHFFHRLGASRISRTLCAASTGMAVDALYGKMPGTAFEDYAKARFVLVWGANPVHSNIHLVPFLKEARRRGAGIAVVDPRLILGADMVDFHLQPFPGTDAVVALAMIHHMDRCGLADRSFLMEHSTGWRELLDCASAWPPERAAAVARVSAGDIVRIAEAYARSEPAVVRCGWGLERNRNGVASVAAVLALPAVAGKFGQAGGGFTLSNSGAARVDASFLAGSAEPDTRVLNMTSLGALLTRELDPPIRALFVYNCNPAVTVPDQNLILEGLSREDLFTVVFDQVMTDTALFADIVLPATTFLEHTELSKSYGSYVIQLSTPVITPQGEARPNSQVFRLLGRAMGWTDGLFAEDDGQLLQRALTAVRGPLEAAYSQPEFLDRKIARFDFPGPAPVQFDTVFPGTFDSRIHLYPEALGPEPYRYLEDSASPDYPLALISPATSTTISSTLGEFNFPIAVLSMHAADAEERMLVEGDIVRVFNELGEVHCPLRLDGRLRPGVISLPKGFWRKASRNGSSGTALVPGRAAALSGGACFNDARVQVDRL